MNDKRVHATTRGRWPRWLACAALLLGTGCLGGEWSDEVTIETDSSATWVLEETGIRAFDDDPEVVTREEGEWVEAVLGGTSEAAEWLRDHGAAGVKSELVRDRAPYEARHEARFDTLEDLAVALGALFHGEASLESEGLERRITVRTAADLPEGVAPDFNGNAPEERRVRRLRVQLAEGIFCPADEPGCSVGFERGEDAPHVAVVIARTPEEAVGGTLASVLSWRLGPIEWPSK